MSLVPGSRVGPYEVLSTLGSGGMGEVYRARDTLLDRPVALKVLPEQVASDPERRARFEREAKALAALNHPNIAQIYGIAQTEAPLTSYALAMELVDGNDLSVRLAGGPMPVDEAIAVARQIGNALEAAHAHGIIHRDLKPANIALTADGQVKVLDFGLAKVVEASPHSSTGIPAPTAPTITTPAMTQAGLILGTAAYMAPEQARGKVIDARADIWAFGCVLFEMLCARRAFGGEDVTEVLARVIEREPDWTALPANTPPGVRRLLKRCLRKDRTQRLQHIGDARLDLDQSESEPSEGEASHTRSRPATRQLIVAAVALLAIGAAAAFAIDRALRPPAAPPASLMRFTLTLPPGTQFPPAVAAQTLAVAPDGTAIAAALSDQSGRSRIYVRNFATEGFELLSGTEGVTALFWSPDSRQIAFATLDRLKRIERIGGGVVEVCATPDVTRTGDWSTDGTIIFQAGSTLFRVAASGGVPEQATTPDVANGEMAHVTPRWLPDGRFLYLVIRGTSDGVVYAQKPDGARDVVATYRGIPQFVPPHWLLIGRMTEPTAALLTAQTFDPRAAGVTADSTTLISRMVPLFSASKTGVVAYRAAMTSGDRFVWVDRKGQQQGASPPLRPFTFDLSRDDRYIAFSESGGGTALFVHDLTRGVTSRLTDGASDPVWSPNGDRLAYAFTREPEHGVAIRPAFGGPEQIVVRTKTPIYIDDWSPDSRFVLGHTNRTDGIAMPIAGGDPITFAQADRIDESRFSPDGRWIAFEAGVRGADEVFLTPFPPTGERWQLSVAGGAQPRWRRNGSAIYYLTMTGALMQVDVRLSPGRTPDIAPPRLVMETGLLTRLGLDQYAPSADDGRFLLRLPVTNEQSNTIHVILNWPQMLSAPALGEDRE